MSSAPVFVVANDKIENGDCETRCWAETTRFLRREAHRTMTVRVFLGK